MIIKVYLFALFLTLFLIGCNNGLTLKSHYNLFGSTVYELTDGNISIKYYNGLCCCIAKEVLEEIKTMVSEGELNWYKFADKKYADERLKVICKMVKGEE